MSETVCRQAQEITFWVIERFENSRSQGYWAGDSSRDFIAEIDNAIHFCRKEDAWRIKRGWHWKDTEVTEHVYLPSAQPSPDAKVEEITREIAEAIADTVSDEIRWPRSIVASNRRKEIIDQYSPIIAGILRRYFPADVPSSESEVMTTANDIQPVGSATSASLKTPGLAGEATEGRPRRGYCSLVSDLHEEKPACLNFRQVPAPAGPEGAPNWMENRLEGSAKYWIKRAEAAELQVQDAAVILRVLNEETVLAGFPGGDRNQTLANVRAMKSRLNTALEALRLAHEWSARFPLQGMRASDADLAAAKQVYDACEAALSGTAQSSLGWAEIALNHITSKEWDNEFIEQQQFESYMGWLISKLEAVKLSGSQSSGGSYDATS